MAAHAPRWLYPTPCQSNQVLEQDSPAKLYVIVEYQGQLLEIPSLSHEKFYTLLEDEALSYGLTHYFKGFYPDQIRLSTANNNCQISLRFYIQ